MEHTPFKKIPRLYRTITITEKIDGTNGLIHIEREMWGDVRGCTDPTVLTIVPDMTEIDNTTGDPLYEFHIRAGSRNRWLTPENDNFGFAEWVAKRAHKLTQLGEGHHYGEWFGKGIQRGYGMSTRRFALFNTKRWYVPSEPTGAMPTEGAAVLPVIAGLTVVPVLYRGVWDDQAITGALDVLRKEGSWASDLQPRPDAEGVVIYHHVAGQYFKVTLENDASRKSDVIRLSDVRKELLARPQQTEDRHLVAV